MVTFLEETIQYLIKKHGSLSELTIVLPSKRAGGFLLNYLKNDAHITSFAPKIISIETFIENVSDLSIIDTTTLLFKSYETYLQLETIPEKESFDTYSSWATTLLGDFNEIDRYLLDTNSFFNYLSDIQDLNHWYLRDDKTPLIEKYLAFWNSLQEFYDTLKNELLKDHFGYQGLVYRKAAEDIPHYIQANKTVKHVFVGFNALNTAEQQITQELLELDHNEVIWDTDAYFFEDLTHSASLFLRLYKTDWNYYQTNPFKAVANNFKKPKEFSFVGVQKNIGQVKYVGNLLATYSKEQLEETAIVLADENLLLPLLHSLPKNVGQVNITMGVPLKTMPYATFFEILFTVKAKATASYYYKDVLSLLNHPFIRHMTPSVSTLVAHIKRENITHSTMESLHSSSDPKCQALIQLLFQEWGGDSATAIRSCIRLLQLSIAATLSPIETVTVSNLQDIFLKIEALQGAYAYVTTLKTIQQLYKELIAATTLDFKGEAYEGLQIMGVLESRVLDFKNIIMTSVNEGTLPSGKSNASFITYDLKQQYNLPKFTEKDAIYTYHFTHLLHRVETATLLYNTHAEGLNTGEKSRFLLQLEIAKEPNHTITHNTVSPNVTMGKKTLAAIEKTPAIVARLQEIASQGFSPSSLTSYVRNPIDFYFQKVLKIKEYQEVEETVAANTLGTIVHDTLEVLYTPFISEILSVEILKSIHPKIAAEIIKQFKKTFKGGDFSTGKNLLIFEVAKQYVSNFIDFEIKEVQAGNEIVIEHLEADLSVSIDIHEMPFPVRIGGKVDRIDHYNGQLRIIDYKTGKVEQKDVSIFEWEKIREDYSYSKAFQVLAYALMYDAKHPIAEVEAGIISFKNLGHGFLKFGVKEQANGSKKNHLISQETLRLFKEQLSQLIIEICNPNIPFEEKEL
ncbi:MAG: ATP-dependent helicase/nuclease subunit B [Patiriisocius sp.]|jgi:ATP-dependent helicase/nuclease subunit B